MVSIFPKADATAIISIMVADELVLLTIIFLSLSHVSSFVINTPTKKAYPHPTAAASVGVKNPP